jgi:hypothetical protein
MLRRQLNQGIVNNAAYQVPSPREKMALSRRATRTLTPTAAAETTTMSTSYLHTTHPAASVHLFFFRSMRPSLLPKASHSTMKLHNINPSSRKISVAVATPVLVLLAFAVFSLYDINFADSYQYIRRASSASSSSSTTTPSLATTPSSSTVPDTSSSSSSPINSSSSSTSPAATTVEACDLTRGQWVPDDEAPYYTNLTCPFIDDLQNCIKFGKPSLEFLRWRWQPDGCDLPRFDAARFLEAMRGKSMAFVGDSLARNHLKSLLCILSQVRTSHACCRWTARCSWRLPREHILFASHGTPIRQLLLVPLPHRPHHTVVVLFV